FRALTLRPSEPKRASSSRRPRCHRQTIEARRTMSRHGLKSGETTDNSRQMLSFAQDRSVQPLQAHPPTLPNQEQRLLGERITGVQTDGAPQLHERNPAFPPAGGDRAPLERRVSV